MPVIDLSNSKIYDAGKRYQGVGAPACLTTTVRNPDGEAVLDKYPPQVHEKWVNGAGHVVRITMANGPGQQPTNTPYWHGKREILRRAKGMPYGKCPFHTEEGLMWMPADMRKTADACDPLDFGRGKEYGEHCACPHIEQIIAERMGNTKRMEAIQAERLKTQAAREAELRARREEALLAHLTMAQSEDTSSLLRNIAGNESLMKALVQMANAQAKDPAKAIEDDAEEE